MPGSAESYSRDHLRNRWLEMLNYQNLLLRVQAELLLLLTMSELFGYVQWNHLGMGKGSWNNHQPYQPTIQCLMEWVKQMMRDPAPKSRKAKVQRGADSSTIQAWGSLVASVKDQKDFACFEVN